MTILKIKRDVAANWTTNDPTPADGEQCLETDTGKIKFGDGVTAWTVLPYAHNIEQLGNTVITNPVDDHVLTYIGNNWVNKVPTGGGGSSPLVAKGDLYTFDTADTLLSVGTDGQVLAADSLENTGLKWITSPAGVTDHTLLSNIGVTSHADIDTHIADTSLHYVQTSISITESQISDLGPYLIDVSGQSITELSDVFTSMVPTQGQVLSFDVTNGWQSTDLVAGSSPLSAKGDLYAHDGTNDVALPAGTDGQVLTTDSVESTGLKWDSKQNLVKYAGSVTQINSVSTVESIVYAPAFDSDGGAWRTKVLASWYNAPVPIGKPLGLFANVTDAEAAGGTAGDWYQRTTSTQFFELTGGAAETEIFRAGSAEFPKFTNIVAETNRVTIFDVSTEPPSMWESRTFAETITSISMTQAVMFIGTTTGVYEFNYAKDSFPVSPVYTTTSIPPLPNSIIIQVKAVDIPDDDVDSVTKLRNVMGAFSTGTTNFSSDGGLSILNDGKIFNSLSTDSFISISVDADLNLFVGRDEINNPVRSYGDIRRLNSAAFTEQHVYQFTSPYVLGGNGNVTSGSYIGNASGVNLLREKYVLGINVGITAHITMTYNTGWDMPGSVGSYLADSVVGSLTGAGTIINRTNILNSSASGDVVGTITTSLMNPGTEIVGYEGFTATDYITIAYSALHDFIADFHIMFHVKRTTDITIGTILDRNDGTNASFNVTMEIDGTLKGTVFDGTTTVSATTTNTFDDGQWHLVEFFRLGATLYIYVGGKQEATADVTVVGSLFNGVATLTIGNSFGLTTPFSNGSISLFKLSNKVPDAEQRHHFVGTERQMIISPCLIKSTNGGGARVKSLEYNGTVNELSVLNEFGEINTFENLVRIKYETNKFTWTAGNNVGISTINLVKSISGTTGTTLELPDIDLRTGNNIEDVVPSNKELSELKGVDITNPSNGENLVYQGGVWINKVGDTGGSPFADLEFSLNLSRVGAILDGTTTDGHVNLGTNSTTGASGSAIDFCTVGGGELNKATAKHSTVGGGVSNFATATASAICGGSNNTNGGQSSFIGAGTGSIVSSNFSNLVGGQNCQITNTGAQFCSILGGVANKIQVAVTHAAVLGGRKSDAGHNYSLATGGGALTRQDLDFVIGGIIGAANPGVANNTMRFAALTGDILIDGAVSTPEADYAEYFEWDDGNPVDEDRVGYGVSLINGKIEIGGNNIIGIVSGAPGIVGDASSNGWNEQYLKDKWGRNLFDNYTRYLWEVTDVNDDLQIIEVYVNKDTNDIFDELPQPMNVTGSMSTKTVITLNAISGVRLSEMCIRRINPAYDNSQVFISRSERPEWDAIGLTGKLLVRTDTPITATMVDIDNHGHAVDGTTYHVLKVIDSTQVRILFK